MRNDIGGLGWIIGKRQEFRFKFYDLHRPEPIPPPPNFDCVGLWDALGYPEEKIIDGILKERQSEAMERERKRQEKAAQTKAGLNPEKFTDGERIDINMSAYGKSFPIGIIFPEQITQEEKESILNKLTSKFRNQKQKEKEKQAKQQK